MKRSLLFAFCLFALPLTLAGGMALAASVTDSSGAASGDDACYRGSSDFVRVRCDVLSYPDSRIGASASANLFVGAGCPAGQPDDNCAVKQSQPVPRTGAEVRSDLVTTVDGAVLANPEVCIEGFGCVVDEEVGHRTVYVFNETGVNEADVWNPSGGQTGVNPPQLCASTDGSCDDGLVSTATSGGVGMEETSPTGWVAPE